MPKRPHVNTRVRPTQAQKDRLMNKLRAVLEVIPLDQKGLAPLVGSSIGTVNRWATAASLPPPEQRALIERVLWLPCGSLMAMEELSESRLKRLKSGWEPPIYERGPGLWILNSRAAQAISGDIAKQEMLTIMPPDDESLTPDEVMDAFTDWSSQFKDRPIPRMVALDWMMKMWKAVNGVARRSADQRPFPDEADGG